MQRDQLGEEIQNHLEMVANDRIERGESAARAASRPPPIRQCTKNT
jgi:hypothetical protein